MVKDVAFWEIQKSHETAISITLCLTIQNENDLNIPFYLLNSLVINFKAIVHPCHQILAKTICNRFIPMHMRLLLWSAKF